MMGKTHLCYPTGRLQLVLLVLAQCILGLLGAPSEMSSSRSYNSDSYIQDSRNGGSCQLYNGTECSQFLAGTYVFIKPPKHLKRLEKKLRRWFKQTRLSRQIRRECWPHAKALTCRLFYPKCSSRDPHNEPEVRPLCAKDCSYVKEICDGEYKLLLSSKYNQKYIPRCGEDEAAIFNKEMPCERLPTYRPKDGHVLFAEPQKHTHVSAGERATLKCFFGIRNFLWTKENKALIRDGTWLRNGKRIIANRRIFVKTKAKGKARLLMLTEIRNTVVRDQGDYKCEITFANRTLQSGAKLSVKPSNRIVVPVVVEKRIAPRTKTINNDALGVFIPKDTDDSRGSENGIKELTKRTSANMRVVNGTCSRYSGDVCSLYLGDTVVFERNLQPMYILNKRLESMFAILKDTGKLSRRCEEFGQAVLCYHKYPRCKGNSQFYVQSLCKKDCLDFTNNYCKNELALLQGDKVTRELLIPNCKILQDDDCLPISKNEVLTGEESVGSNNVANTAPRNQLQNMVNEDDNCFDKNSNRNYFGTLSMTPDGKVCDKWNSYRGYEEIVHDYCRNINNDKEPWCFAGGKKVYCAIKACGMDNSHNSNNNNNLNQQSCYTGVGSEYKGKIAVSRSNRKCWKWSSVTPRYANIDNAYCRNFLGDMSGPWCYVDHFVRELCDIPHCNSFNAGNLGGGGGTAGRNGVSSQSRANTNGNGADSEGNGDSKLVTYVVPFIVGMTVLLFTFFLFAFYWKNKKMLMQQKQQKKVGAADDDILILEDRHLFTPSDPACALNDDVMPGIGVGGGVFFDKTNTMSTNISSSNSNNGIGCGGFASSAEFNTQQNDGVVILGGSSAKDFTFVSSSMSSCGSSSPPPRYPHEAAYHHNSGGKKQNKRSKKNNVIPEVKDACFSNLVKIGDVRIGQLWQGQYTPSSTNGNNTGVENSGNNKNSINVVVQKLRNDTRSCVISEFRNQMAALRGLRHPNIEQIVCISLMSEVPFMAFEGGGYRCSDLKEFIFDNERVDTSLILNFVNQIAAGLEYLHLHKVLHKDLAARNCFLNPHTGVVRLSKSGLGMCRYPNDYTQMMPAAVSSSANTITISMLKNSSAGICTGLTPVRWLSPETLSTGVYRVSTDVYMFGVLIWELFSSGDRPYDEFSDEDTVQEILNENKLICPGTCPVQVWNIVEQCWVVPGCQRPLSALIRRNLRLLTAELET